MKNLHNLILAILSICLFSCEAEVDEKIDLGALPNPSFEISPGDNSNDFILTNTTEGGFITHWDLDGNGSMEGDQVTATFPFAGTYNITMTTFNKGGSASTTKPLTVNQDDPNACFGTFEILTGCDEKVWVLAPEAGALHVGPSLDETWWANGESDVQDRACHFNDQYIFKADGEFEYDNQGDFWADSDSDGNIFPGDMGLAVGCHPSSEWPEKYAAWDSGIHGFSATQNTITVNGLGAWMGLYKIGTASEVSSPQSSVRFDISEISNDRIVLFSDNGNGVWRVTLVSQ